MLTDKYFTVGDIEGNTEIFNINTFCNCFSLDESLDRSAKFCHDLGITGIAQYDDDYYITGSKDGCVRFWNFNELELEIDDMKNENYVTNTI